MRVFRPCSDHSEAEPPTVTHSQTDNLFIPFSRSIKYFFCMIN